MIIPVKTSQGGYNIVLERGVLQNAHKHLKLDRRVLIVTDSGVPEAYSNTVAAQCKAPVILTLPQGEATKCFDSFKRVLEALCENGFTRTDCVVAVGGGVMGDLAGFSAASYMRGIDFYNIPTTVLSQVDSSIGGKTAIDFYGYKNIVGAFYQPKCVLIDPDTLKTLDDRQISNGLAESVKMSLTSDAELFEMLEKDSIDIDTIIYRSLLIKKQVVEEDEKEAGLRKILNFGHTLAHAVESEAGGELLHGECVAIGMLPMCAEDVRKRLMPILKRLNLPTSHSFETSQLIDALKHDKKASGDTISIIYVKKAGSFEIKKVDFDTLSQMIEEGGK